MSGAFPLLEVFGVELEYMIVHRDTLDVLPVSDEVLKAVAGRYESEVEMGELAWSNELVLHVIELKTNGPATTISGLAGKFQRDVQRINELLEPLGGRLMPTAMHPWMDPHRETRLWPHEYSAVYEAYNRIFGCEGHGWSNLQSTHINLPFAGDEEFGRLHAAIRLVLPLLPALAASSPIVEGKATGVLDNRLVYYRKNQAKLPAMVGDVIPEPVFTEADYERKVFEPIRQQIAPHNRDGVLHEKFLNSRGAIARFERGSIEIRLLDIQECPAADLAIVALVVEVLKALVAEEWSAWDSQKAMPSAPLVTILDAAINKAQGAEVADAQYLRLLGLGPTPLPAGEVWRALREKVSGHLDEHSEALDRILTRGSLAKRISQEVEAMGLREVYGELCEGLHEGRVR